MAVGDIYKVRLYCYGSPILCVNTRHYRVSAETGTAATQIQIAGALDAQLAIPLKGVLSSSFTYKGLYSQRIRPTVLVPIAETISAGPGSQAGDVLPTQVAGVISFKTALAGRKYRGRLYTPCTAEPMNTAVGQPSATMITAMNTLGAACIGTVTAGLLGNQTTLIPVVYHRTTATWDDLVTYISRPNWGVIRRRGTGHGADVPPF